MLKSMLQLLLLALLAMVHVQAQSVFTVNTSTIDAGTYNNHPTSLYFKTQIIDPTWTLRIHSLSYPNAVHLTATYADQTITQTIQPKSSPVFFYFKSVISQKLFNVTLIDAVIPSKVYSQQGAFSQLPIDYGVSLTLEGNEFPKYRLNTEYPSYFLNFKCFSLVSNSTNGATFNSGNVSIVTYDAEGVGSFFVDKPSNENCLLYDIISLQRVFYEDITYGNVTVPATLFKSPELKQVLVNGQQTGNNWPYINDNATFVYNGNRFYSNNIFKNNELQYICNLTYQLDQVFNTAQYPVYATVQNDQITCDFNHIKNILNITVEPAPLMLDINIQTIPTIPTIIHPINQLFTSLKLQYTTNPQPNPPNPDPKPQPSNLDSPSSSPPYGVIFGISIPIGVVLLVAIAYYLKVRVRNQQNETERKHFITASSYDSNTSNTAYASV